MLDRSNTADKTVQLNTLTKDDLVNGSSAGLDDGIRLSLLTQDMTVRVDDSPNNQKGAQEEVQESPDQAKEGADRKQEERAKREREEHEERIKYEERIKIADRNNDPRLLERIQGLQTVLAENLKKAGVESADKLPKQYQALVEQIGQLEKQRFAPIEERCNYMAYLLKIGKPEAASQVLIDMTKRDFPEELLRKGLVQFATAQKGTGWLDEQIKSSESTRKLFDTLAEQTIKIDEERLAKELKLSPDQRAQLRDKCNKWRIHQGGHVTSDFTGELYSISPELSKRVNEQRRLAASYEDAAEHIAKLVTNLRKAREFMLKPSHRNREEGLYVPELPTFGVPPVSTYEVPRNP